MMDAVIQFEGTIYENGYGLLAQQVMRNRDLHRNSRTIYAYMCSFASVGKNGERTAFPSVSLQCFELGMTEDTYYKWRKPLIEKGFIKITKQRQEGAKFDNNIYSIIAVPVEPKADEKPEVKASVPTPKKSGTVKKPYPKLSSTEKSSTEKQGTIINSSIITNSKKEEEEEEGAPLHLDSSVKEFLQTELEYEDSLLKEMGEQMTRQNISNFTLEEVTAQHDYMVDKNKVEPITAWAYFFVNGIVRKRNNPKKKSSQPKKTRKDKAPIRTEIVPEWLHKEEEPADKEQENGLSAKDRKQELLNQLHEMNKGIN